MFTQWGNSEDGPTGFVSRFLLGFGVFERRAAGLQCRSLETSASVLGLGIYKFDCSNVQESNRNRSREEKQKKTKTKTRRKKEKERRGGRGREREREIDEETNTHTHTQDQ